MRTRLSRKHEIKVFRDDAEIQSTVYEENVCLIGKLFMSANTVKQEK